MKVLSFLIKARHYRSTSVLMLCRELQTKHLDISSVVRRTEMQTKTWPYLRPIR